MAGDPLAEPISVGIVDDHPVVVEGIKSWLGGDSRLTVVDRGDSTDALTPSVIRTTGVLLLDLNLHGRVVLDEVALLARQGLRIIVYSQMSEGETVLAALEAGACEFIAKHEGRQHLLDAVFSVATNRPYVTPTEAGALAGDQRPGRPRLSERERSALMWWFQSMSKSAVARRMNVSPHTVDMYIRRSRVKYANIGRPAPTKADLLARAIEDGLVVPEDIGSQMIP